MVGFLTVPAQAAAITAGSTQDITPSAMSGETPSAALVFITSAVTNGTNAAHSLSHAGFYDGTRQQAVSHLGRDNVGTSIVSRGNSNNRFIFICSGTNSTATDGQATVAFISGGIRLTWTELPSVAYLLQVVLIAGTDVSVYADYVSNITTSLVDITDPGFQPEQVFFASVVDGLVNTVVSPSGNNTFSFGASDGTTHAGLGRSIRDQQTSMRNSAIMSTSLVTLDHANTSVNDSLAASAFDSSGFSLTPATDWTGNHVIYLAISSGGAGSISLKTYDTPTATGNDSLATMAAEPECVLMVGSNLEARNSFQQTGQTESFSFHMFDATDEFSVQASDDDGPTTSVTYGRVNTKAIDVQDRAGPPVALQVADFVSLDAAGFTLDYTTAANANALMFFAIGFEGVAGGAPAGNPWYYYAQQKAA